MAGAGCPIAGFESAWRLASPLQTLCFSPVCLSQGFARLVPCGQTDRLPAVSHLMCLTSPRWTDRLPAVSQGERVEADTARHVR
eukprot:364859-Chlamydomonas_euryale.AAC.4